jgi:hypothetical protein
MNSQEQKQTLIVQPKKALYIFGGVGIIMVILSLVGQYVSSPQNLSGIRFPFQADIINDYMLEFDFNGKPNIVIYYIVLILDVAAFLLFVISYLKKSVKDKYRFQWSAMAWIVLALSIDNLAVIHKKINEYVQSWSSSGGWFEYKWVIAGAVTLVILVAFFFRFWQHLDPKYKVLFLVPAVMYFGGALGKEYSLFIALDQALQYGAATLLIYSLLLYIKSEYPSFSVQTKG